MRWSHRHDRRSTVNLWPPSDRQVTAKRPSKDRQIFWNTLFYKVLQLSILAALSGAGWSWYAMKMLHLRAVSRKTARSLKTVKITVVLGRLGAPVPLTLHLSWRWRLKIEIGLGSNKKNRTKTESKVASLKNRIYKDRLSQLLRRDEGGGEERKRGRRGVRTGPEGERGGNNEGKGWRERGPKAHPKSSDFGTPMV